MRRVGTLAGCTILLALGLALLNGVYFFGVLAPVAKKHPLLTIIGGLIAIVAGGGSLWNARKKASEER